MDGSSKVDIKSLISGWEAKTQGDQQPVQRQEASATGAMQRPVSINWKSTATIKASEVKRMTLPPTKGDVTVQKPPQKSLEVQAKEIKLPAGEKAPPSLEAKPDAISIDSRAASESEVELPPHPDDPLPKPPLEASARKTVQLQKLKEMGSIQDIKAFAGITETKKTDSASLLQQQMATKMEAKEAWNKLDPDVQSFLPKLGIIDSNFVATPPRAEGDPTPEKMRENFTKAIVMVDPEMQEKLAAGIALGVKVAEGSDQRQQAISFLMLCADANDFVLLSAKEEKKNHFETALKGLQTDPRTTPAEQKQIADFLSRPHHEAATPPPLFSKETGISPQSFGEKVRGSKGKAYKKLVQDFAASMTNAELKRMESVKKTGDLFPFGVPGKPCSAVAKSYVDDFNGLSNFVEETIVSQKDMRDAKKMAQFYADVVVELGDQGFGDRRGANLNSQAAIGCGFQAAAISRLDLLSSLSKKQQKVINDVNDRETSGYQSMAEKMQTNAVVPDYLILSKRTFSVDGKRNLEAKIGALSGAVELFDGVHQNVKKGGTIPPATLSLQQGSFTENKRWEESLRLKPRPKKT